MLAPSDNPGPMRLTPVFDTCCGSVQVEAPAPQPKQCEKMSRCAKGSLFLRMGCTLFIRSIFAAIKDFASVHALGRTGPVRRQRMPPICRVSRRCFPSQRSPLKITQTVLLNRSLIWAPGRVSVLKMSRALKKHFGDRTTTASLACASQGPHKSYM